MIQKQEVLDLFGKTKFNATIIKYFIQELKTILANFKDKNHEKRIEELHDFYYNFEKRLTKKDPEPENYLEDEIKDLFLQVNEYLTKKEAKNLLEKAKQLLKDYS